MLPLSYSGYRFPPDIIQRAVWLYLRFTLSFRDVEELLAERGIEVTYESIRRWVLAFGPVIARRLAGPASQAAQPSVPRRDVHPHRRQTDVSLAGRGRRRRGPGRAAPGQEGSARRS